MLASSKRFALMHEIGGSEEEWSLDQLLEKMSAVDLILVEGFKSSNIPKIQTIRKASLENEGMGQMNNIVAYAADMPIETYLPVLEIDDVVKVADFIIKYLNINVS